MPTLQTYANHPDILPLYRGRYSTALPGTTVVPFVIWLNDLLEELQERGFLPSLTKETGVLVQKERWLTKPANYLELIKVYDPEDETNELRVEDVENKFKLMDVELEDEDSADQITSASFGTYGADGVTCVDLVSSAYIEDYFENYLFLITSGTLVDTSLVVHENDAAVNPGGTHIHFLHALSAALSGTKVTAARLVPPQYYVMMKYRALITAISAMSDEVPIENDCENRLVPAWLRWKCERAIQADSTATRYWENQKDEILFSIQSSRLGRMITPVHGRRLAGYERGYGYSKPHPDYSEFS
jgi:ribosomal protein L39E